MSNVNDEAVSAVSGETVSIIEPGPRRSRRRENLDNWRVMKWLESEIAQRDLTLREVARRMGQSNATRVGEYLRQRIVPGPAVLSSLAMAVGVSPIAALWLADHREAVFGYLHALYQLGWAWMREDHVGFGGTGSGADFIGYYIHRAAGGQIPMGIDLNVVPDDLRDRYHQADVYNYTGPYKHIALPKPMACAILLAIGLFPRRGEEVHEQTHTFIEELGFIAIRMIPAAERVTVPKELSGLQRPLKAALQILPLRYYGDMRLAVVGEYVHAWADSICRDYANYARIALYENGSFIGEPRESENLWEWQRTAYPMLMDLDIGNARSDQTPEH